MRLTLALMRKKMPKGNIWLGKNRLAHHIYPLNIERMVKRLQLEENNMLLLRHPYLTKEQEKLYKKETNEPFEQLKITKLVEASSRTRPSVRMESTLGHLLCGEKWGV